VTTLDVIIMIAMAILLILCVGTIWVSHYWVKGMVEEYNKEHPINHGPTKHPDKYTGPEDEPEWEAYSRRIGRWY
jgi:hypothetical protein